jgi:acetyltransferase-like isoleucine patch superfamily enzyme
MNNLFYIFTMVKNLIVSLKDGLIYHYNLAKTQRNNPDCKFYNGVRITNSDFGKYNVFFKNVTIINSNIDSHTYIQERSFIVNTDIGKFCSIAQNVSIGPGIHKIDGVSTHPAFYALNTPLLKTFSLNDSFLTSKRTIIGNDVWIGEKVVIIDGVNIGTGAIIAAGAVVTKDVEPYSIVGGIPAKHIKFRFTDDKVKGLLLSDWWNQDDAWLEGHINDFSEIDKFIKMRWTGI